MRFLSQLRDYPISDHFDKIKKRLGWGLLNKDSLKPVKKKLLSFAITSPKKRVGGFAFCFSMIHSNVSVHK